MSSLERAVEKLVKIVECPYCDPPVHITVKNPKWKRVRCPSCGTRINVQFTNHKQYVKTMTEIGSHPSVKRLIPKGLPPPIILKEVMK